ncbi:acyl-CoA reductase-like NAD-dependent aldehyde dehydrogenase [Bradyrhizobium sp. GM6.1]
MIAMQRFAPWPRLLFLPSQYRARLASRLALECGMVGVNTGLITSEVAPFGGVAGGCPQ